MSIAKVFQIFVLLLLVILGRQVFTISVYAQEADHSPSLRKWGGGLEVGAYVSPSMRASDNFQSSGSLSGIVHIWGRYSPIKQLDIISGLEFSSGNNSSALFIDSIHYSGHPSMIQEQLQSYFYIGLPVELQFYFLQSHGMQLGTSIGFDHYTKTVYNSVYYSYSQIDTARVDAEDRFSLGRCLRYLFENGRPNYFISGVHFLYIMSEKLALSVNYRIQTDFRRRESYWKNSGLYHQIMMGIVF